MIAVTVMEKRAGWGAEYPADLRNGEWEYARFTPDGKLNTGANDKACFQCHKPHEKQDFVKTGANDVNIAGFAFGPQKLSIGAGRSVT